jgi:hypothetical protein
LRVCACVSYPRAPRSRCCVRAMCARGVRERGGAGRGRARRRRRRRPPPAPRPARAHACARQGQGAVGHAPLALSSLPRRVRLGRTGPGLADGRKEHAGAGLGRRAEAARSRRLSSPPRCGAGRSARVAPRGRRRVFLRLRGCGEEAPPCCAAAASHLRHQRHASHALHLLPHAAAAARNRVARERAARRQCAGRRVGSRLGGAGPDPGSGPAILLPSDTDS